MKIAIIGHTSLLARQLIKAFETEHMQLFLFGRDQNNSEIRYFNVPDQLIDVNNLTDMDWVFYMAGVGIQPGSSPTKEALYSVNCYEPIRILNELEYLNYKGTFVSFGSYFEIGDTTHLKGFTEEEIVFSQHKALNEYSISKRLLSRYLYDFYQKNGSPHAYHFYLPNIYCANENENRLIPYIVNSILNGVDINLSNGKQIRQYIHVDDITSFLKSLTIDHIRKPSNFYSITANQSVSIEEIVSEILILAEERGLTIPFVNFGKIQTRDAHAPYLILDDSKARTDFSWNPVISLREGIINYFNRYG